MYVFVLFAILRIHKSSCNTQNQPILTGHFSLCSAKLYNKIRDRVLKCYRPPIKPKIKKCRIKKYIPKHSSDTLSPMKSYAFFEPISRCYFDEEQGKEINEIIPYKDLISRTPLLTKLQITNFEGFQCSCIPKV